MKRISLLALSLMILLQGCGRREDPTPQNYQLKLDPTTLVLSAAGEAQTVQVTTDAPSWKAEASADWIKVSTSGNTISVSAEANTSKDSRNGAVRVTAGETRAEVSVLQGGKQTRPADDPYPLADYGLDDESIFVKENYSKGITAANPEQKTFTVPASSVGTQKPETGQKLIMNTPTDLFPDGLLAEVVSVSESGGNYTVTYKDLKLEEAFTELRIDETDLDIGGALKKVVDADGNEVAFTKTKATDQESFHIEIPDASWPTGLIEGLEFKPTMKTDLTMTFQAIIADAKLYTFNASVKTDLTVGGTISLGIEGKAIDKRKPIYSMYFAAIAVGPVLVTPFVQLEAVYYVSGKVSIEATATYHTVQRQGVHYDAVGGWGCIDYSQMNDNGEWTEWSLSPKVEGSVAYGLGIGPYFGVYGKVVAAGISMDVLLKETVSEAFNLLDGDPSRYLDMNFVEHLQNIEYNYSTVTRAVFNIELVGMNAESFDLPEVTLSSNTMKIIPSVDKETFEFERTDDGMELTIDIYNKHLLGGTLYALMKENGGRPDSEARKVYFQDAGAALDKLNEQEDGGDMKIPVTAFASLADDDSDLMYADIMYQTPDFTDPLCLASLELAYDDTEARAALIKILQDIARSKDGTWDGCNWFNTNQAVDRMKNVKTSFRGGEFHYTVTLPSDWKVGKNVTVGDYSGNAARFGGWNLVFEGGSDAALEQISIKDPHFTGVVLGTNVLTSFSVNSPLWNNLEEIPSTVTWLDLSKTPVEEIKSNTISENIRSLFLEECPKLKTLTLGPSAEKVAAIDYSVKGSTALESILLQNMTFPPAFFYQNDRGTEKAQLTLQSCTLEDNNFPGNFSSLSVENCTFATITVSGNKTLERIDLSTSKGTGLVVKDCPKMSALVCPDTGISTFEVENLPEMVYINVENNENLKRLVPEVFDEIPERGGSVDYDIRYSYTDVGGTIEYEDNGYGFWYEGEPECGYHGKEPPKEDEEGYVTYPGDTPARAAFRKVIQDIYRCRKGEWEGCDWLEAKPLSSLMNISAPENASNNETYSVTIPEEWQLGPDVIVKKHNKLPTQQYGGEEGHYEDWQIFIRGDRYYNTFSISDPRCYLIQAPGEAKTFAVHSPSFFFNARGDEPWKYRSHIIPSKIHTLDMRGSGSYEFDYTVDYEHTPKVFKLRRYDGKNLNQALSLKVQYSDADPQPMPTIEIGYNEDNGDEDRGFGGTLRLMNMILPYGDLPIKVEHMKDFELYGCTGDMIYIPQNFSYAAVGESSGYHVNNVPYASGVANIKEIKVLDNNTIKGLDAEVQESVTVSNCPSMKQIYGKAEYSYVIQSCPAVTKIYAGGKNVKIQDCKALEELDYQDNYSGHIYVEDFEVDNCPALSSVDFERNTSIQSIAMTRVSALKYVDFSKCTNLTMVVPSFFEEVWGRDGSIQYEQRYEYSYYGDAPYTAADGTKFDYTDKGYGFYYAGEPAQGYHRNPR